MALSNLTSSCSWSDPACLLSKSRSDGKVGSKISVPICGYYSSFVVLYELMFFWLRNYWSYCYLSILYLFFAKIFLNYKPKEKKIRTITHCLIEMNFLFDVMND